MSEIPVSTLPFVPDIENRTSVPDHRALASDQYHAETRERNEHARDHIDRIRQENRGVRNTRDVIEGRRGNETRQNRYEDRREAITEVPETRSIMNKQKLNYQEGLAVSALSKNEINPPTSSSFYDNRYMIAIVLVIILVICVLVYLFWYKDKKKPEEIVEVAPKEKKKPPPVNKKNLRESLKQIDNKLSELSGGLDNQTLDSQTRTLDNHARSLDAHTSADTHERPNTKADSSKEIESFIGKTREPVKNEFIRSILTFPRLSSHDRKQEREEPDCDTDLSNTEDKEHDSSSTQDNIAQSHDPTLSYTSETPSHLSAASSSATSSPSSSAVSSPSSDPMTQYESIKHESTQEARICANIYRSKRCKAPAEEGSEFCKKHIK